MKKFLAAISVSHTCRAIMRQDPSEEVRYSVMGQALADVRKVLCLQSCIFFFFYFYTRSRTGLHKLWYVLISWADQGSRAHKCVCYIFRTVTRNAVIKSVWRKKNCSWPPLNKYAMNIWLSSLRIRAHLSWRTGKHLHVLHVLRTYSTCSYPGY